MKSLLLVLILVTFVSVSFPSTSGEMKHVIFGGTTADRIYVRDYQILSSGRWDQVRELFFDTDGAVGTVTGTRPNDQGEFSIFYTELVNGKIDARNARIDFDTFQIKSNTRLNISPVTFNIGAWRIQANLSNRTRLHYAESDHDVVSQKVRDTTGKPFLKKTQIFNNDDQFIPVAASVDWWGTHTAQLLFQPSSGDSFADFQGLTPAGKPKNDLKRYRFLNEVANISVGLRYDFSTRSIYTVATRDLKLAGTTNQTSVTLTSFDADNHTPIDGRAVYGFRSIPFGNLLSAASLNTVYLYDAYNRDEPNLSRSYLIYGFPKNGKLLTYVQHFDTFNLNKKFNQLLIGPNDPILQNSDFFYGYYAVGFSVTQ